MYTLYINELKVFAYHGVYGFEKENGQDFLISLEADISGEPATDNIGDSVDYEALALFIKDFVSSNRFDLIEYLAQKLSYALLDKYPRIDEVRVRICKPNAPIDAKFGEIGIKYTLRRNPVYLSLGSNIGDRMENLQSALKRIGALPYCRLESVSKVYITSPVGYANQDDFLNCCVKLKTLLPPHRLLMLLQGIESDMGRVRTFKNAPRIIDIDMLLYEGAVSSDEFLTLPHPRMTERKFVLVPLLDIFDTGLSFRVMLTNFLTSLQNSDTVSYFGDLKLEE